MKLMVPAQPSANMLEQSFRHKNIYEGLPALALSSQEFGNHHSHPYKRYKSEETKNQWYSLESSEKEVA